MNDADIREFTKALCFPLAQEFNMVDAPSENSPDGLDISVLSTDDTTPTSGESSSGSGEGTSDGRETAIAQSGFQCHGRCKGNPIYGDDVHIKRRDGNEAILGSHQQFCAAFYHVDKRPKKLNKAERNPFCLNWYDCIIFQRKRNEYSQPIKVVAVAKFENSDGQPLYEARYTNCIAFPSIKMHAEEFFREDVDREDGELAKLINENPEGIITIYLTFQPCNLSTTLQGTEGTRSEHSCCETLRDIYLHKLQGKRVKLYVKPTHLCNLDEVKDVDARDNRDHVPHDGVTEGQEREHFRKNAVRGIKMLMRNGITISAMTPNDWKYLRSMTVDDEASERLQLDDEISKILEKARQQLH